MRKGKFSENLIINLLREVEKGRAVKNVCREHSVSEATYYQQKVYLTCLITFPFFMTKLTCFSIRMLSSGFSGTAIISAN